jgi:YceI-like domain
MDLTTPASYTVGPDQGQLVVTTGTAGPAARAGHDLTIIVGSWAATLTIATPGAGDTLELWADPGSFVVSAGRGGASPLSPEDMAGIAATIRQEILPRAPIRFESTQVSHTAANDALSVTGGLELAGARRSITFELQCAEDGHLTAEIPLRQTDYGIKPYTVLFGALKVADELTISVDAAL